MTQSNILTLTTQEIGNDIQNLQYDKLNNIVLNTEDIFTLTSSGMYAQYDTSKVSYANNYPIAGLQTVFIVTNSLMMIAYTSSGHIFQSVYTSSWGTWQLISKPDEDTGWMDLPTYGQINTNPPTHPYWELERQQPSFPTGVIYRKKNDIVFVQMKLYDITNTASKNSLIATLPTGFRPSIDLFVNGGLTPDSAGNYPGNLYIKSDGTINFMRSADLTTKAIWTNFSFPV